MPAQGGCSHLPADLQVHHPRIANILSRRARVRGHIPDHFAAEIKVGVGFGTGLLLRGVSHVQNSESMSALEALGLYGDQWHAARLSRLRQPLVGLCL